MTKKIDLSQLSNKIKTFEKLAIFGDRKDFLKVLAQNAGLSDLQKQQINGVVSTLAAANPNSQKLQHDLTDQMNNPTPNFAALTQLLQQAANAIPGDRQEAVKSILNLASQFENLNAPQSDLRVMPEAHITGYAPIPADVQQKLSELLTVNGLNTPIKADGKLGAETKKALEIFKKYYSAADLSGEKLYDAVRSSYNIWKRNERAEEETQATNKPTV